MHPAGNGWQERLDKGYVSIKGHMLKITSCLIGLSLVGSLYGQVEPGAGQWKTWVIPSGSAMRLPAPPASDVTATELQWVKESASLRDPAKLSEIHYWDAGSPA